jgi:hypothetical protein
MITNTPIAALNAAGISYETMQTYVMIMVALVIVITKQLYTNIYLF